MFKKTALEEYLLLLTTNSKIFGKSGGALWNTFENILFWNIRYISKFLIRYYICFWFLLNSKEKPTIRTNFFKSCIQCTEKIENLQKVRSNYIFRKFLFLEFYPNLATSNIFPWLFILLKCFNKLKINRNFKVATTLKHLFSNCMFKKNVRV